MRYGLCGVESSVKATILRCMGLIRCFQEGPCGGYRTKINVPKAVKSKCLAGYLPHSAPNMHRQPDCAVADFQYGVWGKGGDIEVVAALQSYGFARHIQRSLAL